MILSPKSIKWDLLLMVIGVILVTAILLLCMVPPVSRDALIHHLAVPKIYLHHGKMVELPSMIFSYYPMNLALLYMTALYFGNDIAPKLIHYSFGLLTAGLIFSYVNRRINRSYALLGAIFFLSIPIIVKLSITAYVDLGLAFFSTASLLLLFHWIDSGYRLKYLVGSGILCGLAVGVKYNGLITLFLLTFFVPFLYSRYTNIPKKLIFKPMAYALLYLGIALVLFSPWMIRNYHWKQNPVYPLYDRWFNPPARSTEKTEGEGIGGKKFKGHLTYRRYAYGEKWWEIGLLPVRIFFQGKDNDPKYFDGRLNPLLLIFPFFAYFRGRSGAEIPQREKYIFLYFSILFFCFAFFQRTLRIRYIAPIIPPLLILSMIGIQNLVGMARRIVHPIARKTTLGSILLVVVFLFSLNVKYIRDQFTLIRPLDYLTGRITREAFIGRFRQEYPTIQYMNQHLPGDATILFIFMGKRGYYCERKYVLGSMHFGKILKRAESAEGILSRLREGGITHLLIFYPIFDRWAKEQLTPEEFRVMKEFFKNFVRHLYYSAGYGISELQFP